MIGSISSANIVWLLRHRMLVFFFIMVATTMMVISVNYYALPSRTAISNYFSEVSFFRYLPSLEELKAQQNDPESIQRYRQAVRRAACETSWREKSQREQLDDIIKKRNRLLWHMIYDDKHKIIYCYVPKVACTQIKMVMAIIAGTLPNLPLNQIPPEGWLSHETSRHKFLANMTLTDEEVLYRLQNYKKFTFVREPINRLVSAYKNKFIEQKGDGPYIEPFIRYAKEIIPRYRAHNGSQPLVVTEEMLNDVIPFQEFAQWITDKHFSSQGTTNYHWHPASELCFPCAVDYQFIGKMETLGEDMASLYKMFNITEVGYPVATKSSTGKSVPGAISQLKPKTLRDIVDKYKMDMEAFGYELHPYVASLLEKTQSVE